MTPPKMSGGTSVEQALAERRSRRRFRPVDLSVEALSQLCWAAQGVTHGDGHRTAPSAGGLFPLELYAAVGAGLFHYIPGIHACEIIGDGDFRPVLRKHALSQDVLREASCVFVLSAVYERLRSKYNRQAERYAAMEAGHAAQNILLQAVVLGLGGVPIGAFDEDETRAAMGLPERETPLYMIAVGVPR